MFVLQKRETPIRWPVTVRVPADGGAHAKQAFDALFVQLDQSAIDDLAVLGDAEFVRGVLVGWEKVRDADGDALPFTPAAVDAMVAVPYVRKAVVAAYYEMISGIVRKN